MIRLRVRVRRAIRPQAFHANVSFLIKGTLEENKSLVESIASQTMLSRDCYYRSKGASEALIGWLKENDCESVYCREVEPKSIEGADAVPEFQRAVAPAKKNSAVASWRENGSPSIYRRTAERLLQTQQQRLQAFSPSSRAGAIGND